MIRNGLLALVFVLLVLLLVTPLPVQVHSAQPSALRQSAPTFTPTAPLSTLATPVTPPVVVSHDPATFELDTQRPIIAIRFSRAMDHDSVAAALHIEPALPVDLRWQENTLILQPQSPLVQDTYYQFVIAGSATDLAGLRMAADYSWSYLAPSTLIYFGAPNDDDRLRPIEFYFGYAIDIQSVEETIRFDPPIDGAWRWDDDKRQALFEPVAPLPQDTAVTLYFDDQLRTLTGELLAAPPPQRFITPSPIVRVVRSAENNDLTSGLSLTFDQPMDRASVEASFHISPTIEGELVWDAETLVFKPAQGRLDEYTNYTVTVSPTVQSSAGEPVLYKPFIRTISTGQLTAPANFGWGANAQVVDAEGRRAVQFQLDTPDHTLVRIGFHLYRLTLEQFLDRYASGFRGVAGWEQQPIFMGDTERVTSWSVETRGEPSGGAPVRETVIPADTLPGLYILEIEGGNDDKQLLLLLTRHVIMLKQVEGQIVAWVTDINGEPAADVAVNVYARDGVSLAEGRTDEAGVFRTAVEANPQPLIVVAQEGADITATGLSNEWSSRNDQWWGWWQPAPATNHYAAHIHTDRPIYRPGQTVFYKGILRHDEDALISLPDEGTPVTVRIRDARNNVVQTTELATNAYGTVYGQFELAEGAMLGDYGVEMTIGGEPHHQAFKVQDYRKPDYEVTVTTDAPYYFQGDEITIQVESRYFYGEPVPNASVTVRQYALSQRMWWEQTGDNQEYVWHDFGATALEGRTDTEGRFTFTQPASQDSAVQAVDWQSSLRQGIRGIEVTVDDGSRQTVSGFTVVKVYDAAEKLSMDVGGYVKAPGQPFTVQIEAASVEDEPIADRPLRLAIRQTWAPNTDTAATQTLAVVTGADGRASMPVTLAEPGYYELTLRGKDRLDHDISYQSWLFVYDENQPSWFFQSDINLRIGADRATYTPGETARLVIESTLRGPALLTFERGTTRRQQVVNLTAPLTVVETPIQPDDAPNIFVTVNAWQPQDTTLGEQEWASKPDSRLYHASVELQVPVTGKRLSVTITPDQTIYAPRDEATFTVQVRDEEGQPLPAGTRAELSLALVDEAIFRLSDELSGPIFDAFYQDRENLVRTYDGMALIRWFGGGGGGGGGAPIGNPRSDFPDTAVWIPVIETDANGEAVITVMLPDTLTSWRLTARATTAAETRVGETLINVVTQQPLVVRPLLPRTLTSGDQVGISALVHNYSDQAHEISVSLVISPADEGALLRILDSVTQTISVEPGGAQVVGWAVGALREGTAELTVVAIAADSLDDSGEPGLADAVRLALPIQPLAVRDVQNQVGDFSGELTTVITLPENSLTYGSVTVDLHRSIAGSLLDGLEYLTGYPYGCVEQTMSRALPNAVVGRAFAQLGINNPTLQADLPPLINAGLQRLYGYQHNDGGWGWWYDDASDAYQTAWVIFGLAVTREAGHEVDPAVIQRGAEWLKQHLGEMDIRTRAYALYSMAVAGHGDLPATRDLMGRLDELDTFSQAALALAFYSLGVDDKAEQIADQLVERAEVSNGEVVWRSTSEDGYYHHKTMASTIRTTALVLSALVRIRPGHELEPGIVRWLMGQRGVQGWGTTNETSYAILALTDHLLAAEEATVDTTYRLELNGAEMATGVMGPGEPAVRLELTAAQLEPGANTLRIEQSGGGRLYYAINSQHYLAQAQIDATGAIQVERTYLDAASGEPIQTVTPGQLVKVQLTVATDDNRFYMIVEDRLPGGLEALNESLNTTSHIALAYDQEPTYYWQEYGYNHKEVYGDRVSFFITELPVGQRTLTYFARATHAGDFVALPAEAYAMYDLTAWGRSGSQQLSVVE
jgi:alpha-2-macroglobulin